MLNLVVIAESNSQHNAVLLVWLIALWLGTVHNSTLKIATGYLSI